MGIETTESTNSTHETIKALFKIDTIPETNPSLLRGSKLSEAGALQLFLYADSSDWQYHGDRDHETGNRKIDDVLGFIYLHFTNPTYVPDEEELNDTGRELYMDILKRITDSTGTTQQIADSHKKATDIL